ncbi:MAG TPA: ABC transporter permease [Gemmatimonadaceae bacterium]|nr:ABC transporter permease [Gemmatimonadaceae bacterium]
MSHLKLAFRTLFKTPFVTTVAVLSLALGIGSNAAIYSIFNQMLRQPLPVPHPDQLANLRTPGPNPGSQSCGDAGGCDAVFSYPMFRDLEKANTGFSGLAAHRSMAVNVAYGDQTMNAGGLLVSGSYFPVLQLQPALGRLLTPDDDRTIGANFVAVLSYAYWQAHLGGNPGVIGKPIVINGQTFTIVGVAPDGFWGTTLGAQPAVFVPISMRTTVNPTFNGFENRRNYWMYVFGRLKPGVSLDQAKAAINAVYHPIITDVEAPLQKGMSDATMVQFKAKQVMVEDGRRGQSTVGRDAKTPLILLFAITGIVLLIACANIANLLLARGADRTMEMAVRLSLGATRWQIVAQLLTESVLLALLGGAASIVVAHWTLVAIMSMLPPQAATSMQFQLHMSVVWFAAGMSVGTGILFGLFPALQSTRPDLVTALRNNSGKISGTRGAARFRTSLVTAQIALSMALLISAGLFIKSLRNISRVDLGIKVENVATFAISPRRNGYSFARSAAFLDRAEQELAAVPGVVGVSEALVPLVSGENWGNDVNVEGFKRGPDIDANSRFNEVGADYFHVVGMPILSGRDFTSGDNAGAPKVAVVNEAFAKKFHLGRDAVGKRMSMGGNDLDIQIVGLVKDAKYADVKDPVPPVFFIPWRQDTTTGALSYYVRSSGNVEQSLRAIPSVIKKLDPSLPVEDLKTLEQQVKENVFLDRMIGTMSTAFALLATLLAAVGLYGVLAYSVTQRTREIGVRMALGADGGRVRRMVLRQVGLMTLIGGAMGVLAAIALGRGAQSMLYELKGYDPIVMLLSAVVLTAVAGVAGYIPARRASQTDPMHALRYE